MKDKSYVFFVDAHAESVGCQNQRAAAVHELRLPFTAQRRRKISMVDQVFDMPRREIVAEPFKRPNQCKIDDPATG